VLHAKGPILKNRPKFGKNGVLNSKGGNSYKKINYNCGINDNIFGETCSKSPKKCDHVIEP
jgi:hypothetical protein